MVLASEQRDIFLVAVGDVARRSNREFVVGDSDAVVARYRRPLHWLRTKFVVMSGRNDGAACRRCAGDVFSRGSRIVIDETFSVFRHCIINVTTKPLNIPQHTPCRCSLGCRHRYMWRRCRIETSAVFERGGTFRGALFVKKPPKLRIYLYTPHNETTPLIIY